MILDVILSSGLLMYIFSEGLPVFFPCFIKIYSKQFWIFDTEYDPSGNSDSSFYGRVDFLNLLFLYDYFILFHVL